MRGGQPFVTRCLPTGGPESSMCAERVDYARSLGPRERQHRRRLVFVSCKALAGCTVCLYGASPRKFAFFKSNFHCHLAVCALSHSFGLHTCRLALSSLWGEFAFTPHVLKNGPHAIAHAILDAIPRTRPHATTPRALDRHAGVLHVRRAG